ncbi:methyltransferase domain-containing protein [Saccharopolyspora indica]|uniref:class I SAM-dependent methyltransferase n=1 Tax=Saccharopolyspora indica TaxID=1229659 RepID=UPI0022EB40A9|nr:class I SAM-dependent methyltransferase [Saccharopolyspora indica]MDA3645744.1 methyltransferase domain-containing protein [Saccharopolyspora indica]
MYGAASSEIYDVVYTLRGKDYPGESAYLADRIRTKFPAASSLLDIACGTGGHLAHLAELFDDVAGVELSEDMLSVARTRLRDVPLHQGDMRSFDLGRRFDAVVCMFASISHVESADELDAALRCFARHLNPGGVVAIDPWWFPEKFIDGYIGGDVLTPDHRTIARVSHAWREGEESRMDVHYLVADGETGTRHFSETYRYQLFPRARYEKAMRDAGFTVEYVEGVQYGRGLFLGVLEGSVS